MESFNTALVQKDSLVSLARSKDKIVEMDIASMELLVWKRSTRMAPRILFATVPRRMTTKSPMRENSARTNPLPFARRAKLPTDNYSVPMEE